MKRPTELLNLPASWVGWIAGFSMFVATIWSSDSSLNPFVLWPLRVSWSILCGLTAYWIIKRAANSRP